jgi:hypothetical protein
MTDFSKEISDLAAKLEEDMASVNKHYQNVQVSLHGSPTPESLLSEEPSSNVALAYGEDEWSTEIRADGTNTVVLIKDEYGTTVAQGWSRRRKGDTRNQELGTAIAAARAFKEAADVYAELAASLLK